MSLAPGSRVGAFDVVELIGAGAMGEVYRARDRVLQRDVAIKLLTASPEPDEGRRQRIAREARMLAALSHPNVAQVYGVEETASGTAIVMELVRGRTLAEVIGGRPMRWRDAAPCAQQMAMALDAAHERGIVHRDFKPANVMLAPDGTMKVLDFGLAKPAADYGPSRDWATEAGVTRDGDFVGTLLYSSPEQLRGEPVDKRSDIWAFGCVLFEMCAGRPPFPGGSSFETVAAVLERDPDWDCLPPGTPPRVRALLHRCLEKPRQLRLRDIGDALPDLVDEPSPAVAAGLPVVAAETERGRTVSRVAIASLAVFALAGTGMSAWLWVSGRGNPSSPVVGAVRFTLPPEPGLRYGSALSSIEASTVAFAPDGTRLAFIAVREGEPPRIFVRHLRSEAQQPVGGTEGALTVFWSPDGQSLGFVAGGKLRRIGQSGGAAVSLCDVPVGTGIAATWGSRGDILYASVQGEAIYRVPASGGTPTLVVSATADRPRVVWPAFLPDGQRFLYTWLGSGTQGGAVFVDGDGRHHPVLASRSLVQFVEPGYLLSVRDGSLIAHRFDPDGARTMGEPVAVLEPVASSSATGWAEVAASTHGMLAAQQNRDEAAVTVFKRDGTVERELSTRGQYLSLRVSPDESSLLFSRWRPASGTYAVWQMRLDRGAETPLSPISPSMETGEAWVPGMREIVLSVGRGDAPNVYLRDVVTGSERRIGNSPRFQLSSDVSPDRTLVYQQRSEAGDWDLMQVPLDAPGSATPFLATPFSEAGLRFAPRGDRVAFLSNESGSSQVYIAPYPFAGAKTQVSIGGGILPRWRRDGRELYFLSGARRRLMAVSIDPAGRPGEPRVVMDALRWGDFDVLDGGNRFVASIVHVLMSERPLTVILDWPRLLEGASVRPR